MTQAAPLNPLPPVVWALALPMIAMEIVVNAGANGLVGGPDAIGWRSQAIQDFAFSPEYLRQMVILQQYPLDGLYRPFTYPFVHTDLTQAVFVTVILLALSKFVGEVFRWWLFWWSSLPRPPWRRWLIRPFPTPQPR